jgi:hypothetical protein
MAVIDRRTFAFRDQHALGTIKAGRRKLSRKESGKALLIPGKVPVHISDSVDGAGRPSRHLTQNATFFYRLFHAAGISRNFTLQANETPDEIGVALADVEVACQANLFPYCRRKKLTRGCSELYRRLQKRKRSIFARIGVALLGVPSVALLRRPIAVANSPASTTPTWISSF